MDMLVCGGWDAATCSVTTVIQEREGYDMQPMYAQRAGSRNSPALRPLPQVKKKRF
jgi:hypothetical protein